MAFRVNPPPSARVEFDRGHPLAQGLVAAWIARGGVLKDMLGGVGDVVQANSGAAAVTLGGVGFGNAGNTNRAGYVPHSTVWKPTAAITIAALMTKTGGSSGSNSRGFGTENSADGWGMYFFNGTGPHLYMRIGSNWADQAVTSGAGNDPQLYGMTYDGTTFIARCEGSSATQSISGAITQSTVSLDLIGSYGGGLGGGNDSTPGYILAFYIWNRALTAGEWLSLRQAPILLRNRKSGRGGRAAAVYAWAATATTATLASVSKAAAMVRSGSTAAAASRIRAAGVIRAATAPSIGLLARAAAATRTGSAAATGVASRAAAIVRTAASSGIASLAKACGIMRSAGITATAGTARSVGLPRTAAASAIASAGKAASIIRAAVTASLASRGITAAIFRSGAATTAGSVSKAVSRLRIAVAAVVAVADRLQPPSGVLVDFWRRIRATTFRLTGRAGDRARLTEALNPAWPAHPAGSRLDYWMDFDGVSVEGAEIVVVDVTVSGSLTYECSRVERQSVGLWLHGGAIGETCAIRVVVTFASGQTDIRTAFLTVV